VDFEANIAALGGCLLVFLSPVGQTVETSEFHNRTRYFDFFFSRRYASEVTLGRTKSLKSVLVEYDPDIIDKTLCR
jgi:hypothetical protein